MPAYRLHKHARARHLFGGHVCFDVQISLPVLSSKTPSEGEISAQKLAAVLNDRASGFSKRVGRLLHRWLSQFYPAQLVWDVSVLQLLEGAHVVSGPSKMAAATEYFLGVACLVHLRR